MFLRILILFFVSLTLNAAEVVWDKSSAKKIQKISGSEYQSALDSYIDDLKRNPVKAFEKGVQAEKKQEYKSALYFYRLGANQGYSPAQHNLAFMYASNLGVTSSDKELIKKQTLEAQRILNKLNYNASFSFDHGTYNLLTFNAIKSFQADIASEPTGWVDSALLNELSKAERNADNKAKIAQELRDAKEAKRLREAQELVDIIEVQQLLKNLAYYFGALDGSYGPATAQAIKNYQRDSSSRQDGEVTPALISSLKKSYNSYLNQLKNDKGLISRNYKTAYSADEKGDYETALRLYTLSADQGYARAQNNLGNLYYDGEGVKKDYKEAARFYKLSADQGNPEAQNNLGVLYQVGQGVRQNYSEAARLYKRSAAQGNISAKKRIEWLCKSHPSACR